MRMPQEERPINKKHYLIYDFVYFFLNQAKCLHVFFSTILCIYIVYFLDKDILIYDIFFSRIRKIFTYHYIKKKSIKDNN